MSEIKELNYDLVILGGGPAGLSAAIYATRASLKAAIIDTGILGGQVNNTLEVENYPGFGLISGFDLIEKLEAHADKFNPDKYILQEITNINLSSKTKIIETLEYRFKAKAIVLAVGAQPQKLGVPGEQEFAGRGVSYCAVCDGAFFRDKVVTVVGGGNSAVEEAVYLTKFASKVKIVHRRDKLRADKLYQDRALNNPKIEFVWDSVSKEIKGEDKVQALVVENVKTGELTTVETDGVFPYIGYSANSESFRNMIQLDSKGFITTDSNLETSCKGVYAAGDVRVTPLRQIIVAAADGAIAATSAVKYIESIEEHVYSS